MAKVNPLIKPPDRFSRATVTASVVVVVDHNGRADTCPVIRITPDSGLDESQEAFLRHVRRTPLPVVLVRLRSRPIFRKRTPLRATVRARARSRQASTSLINSPIIAAVRVLRRTLLCKSTDGFFATPSSMAIQTASYIADAA